MVKALADAAAAAVGGVAGINREFYYASDLEGITGIPESTWHTTLSPKKDRRLTSSDVGGYGPSSNFGSGFLSSEQRTHERMPVLW